MKKEFEGMDSIFHKTESNNIRKKEPDSSTTTNKKNEIYESKENYFIPKTFRIEDRIVDKLKYIAYFEEISQTEIINESLQKYIDTYEKKNGKIINNKQKK